MDLPLKEQESQSEHFSTTLFDSVCTQLKINDIFEKTWNGVQILLPAASFNQLFMYCAGCCFFSTYLFYSFVFSLHIY